MNKVLAIGTINERELVSNVTNSYLYSHYHIWKHMIEATDNHIKKALVAICVEEALLEIGKPVLDEVERSLYSEFKCFVPDCFDHPEYLKQILEKLYGRGSLNVIQSIHKHLDEYSSPEPIQQFLTIISK